MKQKLSGNNSKLICLDVFFQFKWPQESRKFASHLVTLVLIQNYSNLYWGQGMVTDPYHDNSFPIYLNITFILMFIIQKNTVLIGLNIQ